MGKKFVAASNKITLGLDLSLSGTGVTVLGRDGSVLHQEKICSIKQNTKKNANKTRLVVFDINNNILYEDFIDSNILTDMPRLAFYRDRIKAVISKFNVEQVILEGYSMQSSGRGVTGLAELGGIIRMMIYDLKIPYVQSPPHNAKAYICGIAVAEKEQIMNAIYDRFGISIEDDNIADSFAMAHMFQEFGDNVEEYLSKGGVDKLKIRKANEIRSQVKNPQLMFQRVLKIGQVDINDFKKAVDSLSDKSPAHISKVLEIDQYLISNLLTSDKPKIKKLNEEYRYKKPKKVKASEKE